MTVTDRLSFAQAFNRLAVATRLPSGEADAAMQQVYWDGMIDMPIDAIAAAAESIAKASQWFPKVAEWREVSYQQQIAERLRLPDGREEPWLDECGACQDTGWEELRCYPGTLKNCGRKHCVKGGEHRPEHIYAVRCSCRATNHTYQRHHVPGGRRSFSE